MRRQGTFDALVWAERQRCGGPGPKAVLMALARMAGMAADGSWSCWPSQALLAEITEQSERTVRTQLANLEDAGLISRTKRSRPEGRGRSTDLVTLQLHAAEAAGETTEDLPATDDRPTGNVEPTNRQAVAAQKSQGTASEEPRARGTELAVVATFSDWWALYPRKVAKPAALRAYMRAVKRATPEVIAQGLATWAVYWKARGEPHFIPHPATWLNRDGWDDEPPPLPRPTGLAALDVLDELENDWSLSRQATSMEATAQEASGR